ncbi:hypothetical protein GPECTOR_2g1560 [Gonium pectorale]|uniref:Uncharacterized protein n=1 Tax=Gonium pectorale TaxID=33097 RepID=A0A150H2E7_GONPE|nr:hypothetical protein GPECTOR_2g1560 [Gonium pectorale]|eukprot:KXZ56008.1 hypothetical protein GPECTOR_2g1560 [Gonium pectorale]
MSRSIMKKLYHKNVELEKELAIYKANQPGASLAPPATAGGSRAETASRPGTSAPSSGLESGRDASPAAQALQERDLTIRQLQQALEAARRRCALLELQLTGGGGGGTAGAGSSAPGRGGGTPMSGGSAGGGAVSVERLRDVVVQSAHHHQKYKQIREDYNRLLTKRAVALQGSSRAASAGAAELLEEMRKRLAAEMQEREAEAALYSARLYESEKAMSDWYVEKRLLEEHIARLSAEVGERDRIDGEIERCVSSMLERLHALEAENDALRARLAAHGIGFEETAAAP